MKKIIAALILAFWLWGSMYVVSKMAYSYIPPVTVLLFRYVAACLFLVFFVLRKGFRRISRGHWKYFIFIGAAGYAVGVGMTMMSTSLMDASVSSLINSMNPVVISVIAAVALKERFTVFNAAGIALSIAGVFIILNISGGFSLAGVALSVGGLLLWGFMSVFIRRISGDYSPEQIAFVSMLIAIPCCLAGSAVELHYKSIDFNPMAVLAVLYMGVICTGFANLIWNMSLKKMDAGICAAFYPIQPLASAVLGALLLHETLRLRFFIGAVVVCAGVLINVLGERIFNRLRKTS